MRLIVTCLQLLFVFSLPCLAQPSLCPLTLNEAPEVRGFKLGMTVAQVRARLGGVAIRKPDELGGQMLIANAAMLRKASPTASSSARAAAFTFLDGRLMKLTLLYDDSVKWEDVDEFVFSLSHSLGLPPMWPKQKDSYDNDGYLFTWRELICAGFTVYVALKKNPIKQESSLIIRDARHRDLLYQRHQEVEERKKARFKP